MHTTTTTVRVEPKPAEPGGLDGWSIDCEICGRVGSYSIKTMSEKSARDHVDYMIGAGR